MCCYPKHPNNRRQRGKSEVSLVKSKVHDSPSNHKDDLPPLQICRSKNVSQRPSKRGVSKIYRDVIGLNWVGKRFSSLIMIIYCFTDLKLIFLPQQQQKALKVTDSRSDT